MTNAMECSSENTEWIFFLCNATHPSNVGVIVLLWIRVKFVLILIIWIDWMYFFNPSEVMLLIMLNFNEVVKYHIVINFLLQQASTIFPSSMDEEIYRNWYMDGIVTVYPSVPSQEPKVLKFKVHLFSTYLPWPYMCTVVRLYLVFMGA